MTPVAFWLFTRFVHSSATVSTASLILMAPYIALIQWGQGLPDSAFWGVFIVAQAIYVVVAYVAIRAVVRHFRNR